VPGRSNGLEAPRFTRLIDLDPQLADAALDVLGAHGVAAYAAPVTGAQGGYLDVHLPDRPVDRVWVDAAEVDRARMVLEVELPALRSDLEQPAGPARDEPGDDAAWEALVAAYETGPADPAPWPAQEDLPEPGTSGDDAARPRSRLLRRADHELGDIGLGDAEVVEPAAAQPRRSGEDHFVPPPPPPLPEVHPVTKFAWAGVLGGPAYLVLAAVVDHPLVRQFAWLAVAAFVAGFLTLVARMKDRPPGDTGPDDGAVV